MLVLMLKQMKLQETFMNNNKIVIKTDSGEELIYDIVAMVTNKVGSRNYVYFTKKEKDALLQGAENSIG